MRQVSLPKVNLSQIDAGEMKVELWWVPSYSFCEAFRGTLLTRRDRTRQEQKHTLFSRLSALFQIEERCLTSCDCYFQWHYKASPLQETGSTHRTHNYLVMYEVQVSLKAELVLEMWCLDLVKSWVIVTSWMQHRATAGARTQEHDKAEKMLSPQLNSDITCTRLNSFTNWQWRCT